MLRQNEAEFNQINTNPDQNVFFVNLYKKQIENVYDRFKICETSCIDLFTKLADLPDLKILLEHFNDPPIVNGKFFSFSILYSLQKNFFF